MLLLYKVYLKYMDKPQELVRHINTEKNKFQAYVQKWVVFEVNWTNKLNSKYFCYVLCYKRYNILTIHAPSVITVELLLFINSHFTTNTQ